MSIAEYLLSPGAIFRDLTKSRSKPRKSSTKAVSPPKKVRAMKSVVLHYDMDTSLIGRKNFSDSEYNLIEIAKAVDVDSYIRKSIDKHTELILKNGIQLTSKNDQTRDYVQHRLDEIAIMTRRPFETWFNSFVRNVVQYANGFLVLVRDRRKSSGASLSHYGRTLEPIAGIFSADPSTLKFRQDGKGNVSRWLQQEGNRTKLFDIHSIIHAYHSKKDSFVFGTPFLVPVLDDVRMLRRLEELSEIVCHKHAFPLLQYIVGTDDQPAHMLDDGTSEIDKVQTEIQKVPPEGLFVTSERHKIVAVNQEGARLDLDPFVSHMKSRVLAGLNLSTVDIGEGDRGSRNTAVTMAKSLRDRARDFQKTISVFVSFFLFDQILLEGGFKLTQENRVYLTFPEIDQEELQALENHNMALYQGHAISFEEMRQRSKLEPNVDEGGMFINRVEIPLIKEKGKIEEAKAQMAAVVSSKKTEASKKSTANKNRPTNQHGTKTAKTQRSTDQLLEQLRVGMIELAHSNGDEEKVEALCDDLFDEFARIHAKPSEAARRTSILLVNIQAKRLFTSALSRSSGHLLLAGPLASIRTMLSALPFEKEKNDASRTSGESQGSDEEVLGEDPEGVGHEREEEPQLQGHVHPGG